MTSPKPDPKAVAQDLRTLREFVQEVERLGGRMPDLTRALNRLQWALDTGADLVSAAEETRGVLSLYVADLHRACGDDFVCQAHIDRAWQARNVAWVLSWNKRESVLRLFLRNILRRLWGELKSDMKDATRAPIPALP